MFKHRPETNLILFDLINKQRGYTITNISKKHVDVVSVSKATSNEFCILHRAMKTQHLFLPRVSLTFTDSDGNDHQTETLLLLRIKAATFYNFERSFVDSKDNDRIMS